MTQRHVMTDTVTPSRLDPALLDLAAAQHGMLTTAQANNFGLDGFALSRLAKAGLLVHPGRGLYAVASLVDREDVAWHRHLTHGARLLHDDVVVTGVTSLIAHDVTVWKADLTRPQLLRPVHRSSTLSCFRLRPLHPRRRENQPFVDTPLGPSVSLADALVDHAIESSIESAVVSFDNALQSGKVTDAALEGAVAACASWPGSSRARSALGLCDGRRESVAESRVGVALAAAGFDLIPQVEIRDDRGWLVGRVDFILRGTKVIIEVDGKVKYASGDPEVLWREKKREDALRALGYIVVRITWADLERPGAVVAKLRTALAAA